MQSDSPHKHQKRRSQSSDIDTMEIKRTKTPGKLVFILQYKILKSSNKTPLVGSNFNILVTLKLTDLQIVQLKHLKSGTYYP